ncbi:DUF72 domain-containing protein [Sphingomonas sp.]|jgi:uncharacterized protein YecE (DUF72 family)|uniref:DUF72 domain-containing protein n=1 Tax=Sphingomonas sp. TaxID=28214 RepID=UPI002ED8A693
MSAHRTVRIGTAGWAIGAAFRNRFPAQGTSLQRYATRLAAVEINSSFHRPHRPATYARWAGSVPDDFRFATKVPRAITHDARLANCDDLLSAFAAECGALGAKLAVILVQLPPSLAFDPAMAAFFAGVAGHFDAAIACEPRHASWFEGEVDAWLAERRIARVAADPARHRHAGEPGGWRGLTYYRLHGSPVIYRSSYDDAAITDMAGQLAADAAPERWCIFDNTASSAALGNALDLGAPERLNLFLAPPPALRR